MKLSKEQIKEFYEKHKKIVLGGGAAIVLVLILVIAGLSGGEEEEPVAEEPEPEPTEEEIAAENWALMTNDLEKDAYPEVNALVEAYFTSMAEGDIDAVATLVVDLQEEEKEQIEEKQEYLEAYQNIECYTKKGPEINTYIVFVCYEEKYVDIETPVPSLKPLYVVATAEELIAVAEGADEDAVDEEASDADDSKAEGADTEKEADGEDADTDGEDADADDNQEDADGEDADTDDTEGASELNYYICNSGLDEETIGYINSISAEDDVLELYEQVRDAYANAIESDETLSKFVNKLLKAAGIEDANTAEETAEAEEEEQPEETADAKEEEQPEKNEETKEEEQPEETASAEESTSTSDEEARTKANQGAPGRFVTLSNAVNIRASYNEDAKLVYTAAPGEVLRVEMDYAEGWSKVTVYDNGKVGYVKTMYLE